MKCLFAFAALALALAGCDVPQGRDREADATAKAAYAQCEELRESGQIKSELAAVDCAVPTVVAAYQEAAYPFDDLIYISVQARRAGARKVDDGIIGRSQYLHDVAALDARIAAESARRHKAMEFGGNPKPAPLGVLLGGLPSFARAPTAAAVPPGGCVPLGGIRTCP